MLSAQMSSSGLGDLFERLLSVDQVRKFKPAPETYHMAARKLGVDHAQIRLVAAHDWDVFGALSAGCRGAYIARKGRVYHPLYEKPDIMGPDLVDVVGQILQVDGAGQDD
jgi:2-haloacid dehalogenase